MVEIYNVRDDITLEDIINGARNPVGGAIYALPDIQREYEWSPARVVRLIDTILRGWPFGTLVLWDQERIEKKDRIPYHGFLSSVDRTEGRTTGVPINPTNTNLQLVLDGQQRLQSLLLATGWNGWGFKLPDKAWAASVEELGMLPDNVSKSELWTIGELFLDLKHLKEKVAPCGDITMIDWCKALTWARPQATARNAPTEQSGRRPSYKSPLISVEGCPECFIPFGEFWKLARIDSDTPSNYRVPVNDLLAQYNINDADTMIISAVENLIFKIGQTKKLRIGTLHLLTPSDTGQSTLHAHLRSIVEIFTRLNAGGMELTPEDITFAWIKKDWNCTNHPDARVAFGDLHKALRGEDHGEFEIDMSKVIDTVSLLWSIAHHGGNLLKTEDLLHGDVVSEMSQAVSGEWEAIRDNVKATAKDLAEIGLEYKRIYGSFYAFQILCAWRMLAVKCREGIQGRDTQTSFDEEVDRSFKKLSVPWIVLTHLAGRWSGDEARLTYARSLAKLYKQLSAPADRATGNGLDVWRNWMINQIEEAKEKAIYIIGQFEVFDRNAVTVYRLALWVWHNRISEPRKGISETPMLCGRAKTPGLHVDHIVPHALAEDWGWEDAGSDKNINAIGNCQLLLCSLNQAKNKKSLMDFLLGVKAFNENRDESIRNWVDVMSIPQALLNPQSHTQDSVWEEIKVRTNTVKNDLIKYISNSVS